MKKLLVIFIVLLLSSCSSNVVKEDASNTIIGKIIMTGNEPFVKLSLETSEGKIYFIEAEEQIIKELNNLQGMKLNIYYSKIKNTTLGDVIEVVKYSK